MKKLALLQSLITLGWLSVCLMILLLVFPLLISTTYPAEETKGSDAIATAQPVGLSDSESEAFKLGKQLFKLNCASCHNKNMLDDMTGPALSGVKERWSAYPEKDLHDWIRNSGSLIEQRHPRAVKVWEKWNRAPMNSFPNLTDVEIEAVLVYIENNG